MIYDFRKSQLERIVMVSFKPEAGTVSFMLDDGSYLKNVGDKNDFKFGLSERLGSEYIGVELLISILTAFTCNQFEPLGLSKVDNVIIYSWRKKGSEEKR